MCRLLGMTCVDACSEILECKHRQLAGGCKSALLVQKSERMQVANLRCGAKALAARR